MTIDRRPLVIRDPNHALGENTAVERHSVRQALAWTIATELVRRHPGDARVIETHPGGGQYDCVTVNARASGEDAEWPGGWRTIAHMNKEQGGHITHQGWFSEDGGSERFNWLEVLLSPDIRTSVVNPLEEAEGWPAPKHTPSTSSQSIGVRLLGAFAQRVALSRKPWTLLNGYVDSSGYDGGVREDLFAQVPAADAHRSQRRPDDLFGIPEYRYWFLIEDGRAGEEGQVRLSVDTMEGVAFAGAQTIDLMAEYKKCGRMIDALASRVCPPAY
jgi:hypothetical protein